MSFRYLEFLSAVAARATSPADEGWHQNDAKVAKSLRRCRGIDFHPVVVSDDQLESLAERPIVKRAGGGKLQVAQRLATHLTLWAMVETGQLGGVFSAFEPSRPVA